MPNQYSKVPLKVITEFPKDNKVLTENYSRALVKMLLSRTAQGSKVNR